LGEDLSSAIFTPSAVVETPRSVLSAERFHPEFILVDSFGQSLPAAFVRDMKISATARTNSSSDTLVSYTVIDGEMGNSSRGHSFNLTLQLAFPVNDPIVLRYEAVLPEVWRAVQNARAPRAFTSDMMGTGVLDAPTIVRGCQAGKEVDTSIISFVVGEEFEFSRCEVCPSGRFNADSMGQCHDCPANAVCTATAALATPGYWRDPQSTEINPTFYQCHPPELCCPEPNATTGGCDLATACVEHATGTLW
jgi:hypothetical protein